MTTLNDYSVSGEMIAPIRELTAHPGAAGGWAPHLNEAIRFGVPGGHGTEYGWGSFFTMQTATARAAHFMMPRALAYDPDVIKVFSDGWRYGRDPDEMSMNVQTLSAIVADAHSAGKPVVTHTVTLEASKVAAAAGVDALGHGVGDAPIDDELIGLMKKAGTSYIATLVVYEPQQARVLPPGELALLDAGERADEAAIPRGAIEPYDARRWKIMQDNIGRAEEGENPYRDRHRCGDRRGLSRPVGAMREIWWMTQLGLTPAEALVAATRASALAMNRQAKTGLVAPGMRADLVLVDGEPDKRIDDLARVSRVWVSGREVAARSPARTARQSRRHPAAQRGDDGSRAERCARRRAHRSRYAAGRHHRAGYRPFAPDPARQAGRQADLPRRADGRRARAPTSSGSSRSPAARSSSPTRAASRGSRSRRAAPATTGW